MDIKIIFKYLIITILLFTPIVHATDNVTKNNLYINQQLSPVFSEKDKKELDSLVCLFSKDINTSDDIDTFNEIYYTFQEYDIASSVIILENGSKWKMGWWYTSVPKNWKTGDQLKIAYHSTYSISNPVEITNIDTPSTAWGAFQQLPFADKTETIARIPNGIGYPNIWKEVYLKSGWIFYISDETLRYSGWQVKDEIFIFHNKNGTYDLWNLDKEDIIRNFTLMGNEKFQNFESVAFTDLLHLNERLDSLILGQSEATEAVASSMLNYGAGLKDPQMPIAAFLFIGPTGVGKTELAKALTRELYHDERNLIRFDMGNFSQDFSLTRLIGSPPGYVNHEEGGQLTEALKNRPQSVVLLDEFEKAHPSIHKFFLPTFDEGYIIDAKNTEISCRETIFIMTSNLCSQQIAALFKEGYSSNDVLSIIEPTLIESLSPELYNRLEPIIFRPLGEEVMSDLVDIELDLIIKRLKEIKNFTLYVDDSVKQYLIFNGFHPDLGARPLKKLIEKTVILSIAKAIISDNIPEGSDITVFYSSSDDSWFVEWSI